MVKMMEMMTQQQETILLLLNFASSMGDPAPFNLPAAERILGG